MDRRRAMPVRLEFSGQRLAWELYRRTTGDFRWAATDGHLGDRRAARDLRRQPLWLRVAWLYERVCQSNLRPGWPIFIEWKDYPTAGVEQRVVHTTPWLRPGSSRAYRLHRWALVVLLALRLARSLRECTGRRGLRGFARLGVPQDLACGCSGFLAGVFASHLSHLPSLWRCAGTPLTLLSGQRFSPRVTGDHIATGSPAAIPLTEADVARPSACLPM
jgi:hypothetical protein